MNTITELGIAQRSVQEIIGIIIVNCKISSCNVLRNAVGLERGLPL